MDASHPAFMTVVGLHQAKDAIDHAIAHLEQEHNVLAGACLRTATHKIAYASESLLSLVIRSERHAFAVKRSINPEE